MSLPDAARRGASASLSEAPGSRRFPRTSRLRARRQFLTVYATGHRVRGSWLTIFGLPNDEGQCRLGITATRKIGGAVVRNRVKRMMRDIFRRHRLQLEPPMDIVVNAHRSFPERTSQEIEREFLSCFAKLARRTRR